MSKPAGQQDGGRTGRRPGQSGTREAILDAARHRFAQVGFDKASIRSIAAEAGVDSALVHHYFGTKQDLFVAVVALPVDPVIVLGPLNAAPIDRLGEQIIRTVVGAWDSPAGVGVLAAFRGVIAGADPTLIRTFLVEIALKDVRVRVDVPKGSGDKRIALVASQMFGLLAARKIIEIEPIASMSLDELVPLVAPTLQRYLTGDLP
ncbi:TetR family transcriptional regulator [Antrihabitans sp. YC2-6]|uniref:TetR/AcrR family transcriptional regulator n=1 Tax=Antrihabitans sp. YC2-6 TaxID=2799498 RepID=UPI0018F6C707|nr:TetR family transcriptional regulator [Antrihabitans sp. YC2-6]MBJ8343041.1 TetR family transcriptional regulator [Antrihabitans sp. YC2-6]